MYSNIHTHTHYCDGKEAPRNYVLAAIEKGLVSLGFSAHAPVPFDCNWAIPQDRFNDYIAEIKHLQVEFASKIQIYLGLEIDYFPDIPTYTTELIQRSPLDYFIGSLHFIDAYPDGRRWTIDGPNEEFRNGFHKVFQDDSILVTRKFFEYTRRMIQDLKPPVIGHLDKIKMQHQPGFYISEDHPVFREEVLKTLDQIKNTNSIVEVNTRGIYKNKYAGFYPGIWAIQEMAKRNIKVMVNSDAHQSSELLNEFPLAFAALRNAGYQKHYILKDGNFIPVEIPFFYNL
jgi:histidinol-phosphatase (PHP family)